MIGFAEGKGITINTRHRMRISTACLAFASAALLPNASAAQQTRRDSVAADSARRLEAVRVTVARSTDDVSRLPWSVSVLTAADVRGSRATLSVDEALNDIPGVFASNRYIYALDQVRLSVRGAGARANFGARGVKILLDGVSQTLPDGQSQMTNIELGTIGRIEVLRGAASSLYGNGSGGVLSFETDMRAPDRLRQELRVLGGSFGMTKWQFRTIGRTGRAVGSLSVSQTVSEGFRQYSEAEVRQINAALNYAVGANSTLELRANAAWLPRSLNPGALTEAEWRANPDSAVPANVTRGALKDVSQQQISLGWRRDAETGTSVRAAAFVTLRDVDNPIAAQPPAPRNPENGTRVTLDRSVVGARVDVVQQLGTGPTASRLAVGFDAQRFRDVRRNERTTFGQVTALNDTILVHQVESVVGLGPFAQLSWSPMPLAFISAGVRWDYHAFKAQDRHLSDGFDDTGERTMSAVSSHFGASYLITPWFTPFAHVASAFETPTTTEMQVRSTGLGGFNSELDPQTTNTIEVGVRGSGERFSYELTTHRGRTRDALIQYSAENERAYFRNAGRLRSTGVEAGTRIALASWLETRLAYTFSRYEFEEYRIPTDDGETVLDGKRLAGVPDHFVRAGLRTGVGGLSLDADWTWSDAVWGNDANTALIEDWGSGRLDVRMAFLGTAGGQRFQPFVGVSNALDQIYAGSVTLNGFGGRYFESAPRRHWYAGVELGWRVLQ